MGRRAPLQLCRRHNAGPQHKVLQRVGKYISITLPTTKPKPTTLSLGRNKNSDGLTPVSIQTPFMGVDFRAAKIPRMKRSFDTMSQAMDWASSSAGVRKPAIRRLPE